MNKKLLFTMIMICIFSVKSVTGTQFSGYLPGGKNYIDPDNIQIDINYIGFNDLIRVKGDTDYTISFPGIDLLGEDIYIDINGNSVYLSNHIEENPSCEVDAEYVFCTFRTAPDEEFIFFELSAPRLSLFIDSYGFTGFQLEEGLLMTSYEEYIIPLVDTNDPEFSGAGAYIVSYQSSESISTIINNHIYADDEVDGDLSSQIIIVEDNYTANIGIVGNYIVNLSVSDSSGNTAYFSLTVIIKDEIAPIIVGPAFIDVNVNDSTPLIDIIDQYFILGDEYDSNPSLNILSDYYSLSSSTTGNYFVEISLIDSSENITDKSFIINVLDTDAPVMIGEVMHNSYLSSHLNTSDIINSLSFTDNHDDVSVLSPTITSNGLLGNELIPGTYFIDIELEDLSNNTLYKTLTVNVVDDIAPSISGPATYSSSYTVNNTVQDIEDMLSVSDNVDSLSNDDIYIISDNYTNRNVEIGEFQIVFGIVDSNNNESTHQINITLFDDVAPVIYIDSYIITVNLNATFNEQDALSILISTNELETGNYEILTVYDEYSGNEKNPGTYLYELSFTDDNGLTKHKEFIVKVQGVDQVDFEKSLLVRNIIIYSVVVIVFGFVFYKYKKKTIE